MKLCGEDFIDVSDKLGDELPVSTREMNACTIMMATLLTFRSWQRPGAVANATLVEYKNRTEVQHERETVTIIKVQLIGTNISRVSASSVIFQNKFPMRALTCKSELQLATHHIPPTADDTYRDNVVTLPHCLVCYTTYSCDLTVSCELSFLLFTSAHQLS